MPLQCGEERVANPAQAAVVVRHCADWRDGQQLLHPCRLVVVACRPVALPSAALLHLQRGPELQEPVAAGASVP
eukprot:7407302-Lingulodinium_polyedra.AAC.1